MNCLSRGLSIIALVASVLVAPADAATIFTNLPGQPGTIASNLPVGFTGADWTYGAQQFNSGANTQITGATLLLARAAGTVTGTYNVEVWTDSSNAPGTLVGAIATGQSPSGVSLSGPQLMAYTGNVSVVANTNYWLVMNMSDNTSQLQWQYTNAAPTTAGFIGVTGTSLLESADPPVNPGDPLAWATPGGITDGRLMMEVVAVPEPTTLGLLAAAGIAGSSVLGRRRR